VSVRIIIGDALAQLRVMPAESVHCCVTSPPYYGLRDYGTAQWEGGDEDCDHKQGRPGAGRADGIVDERAQRNRDGIGAMGGDCRQCGAVRIDQQIGIEPSPDEYIAALVAVFREVRRVLRKDGTLWLNIGDSYASSPPGNKTVGVSAKSGLHGINGQSGQYRETLAGGHATKRDTSKIAGIKPKDLIGIPWMLAFALRADGWWLRQDIIWAKPNPMPESVTDRCTKAHEYMFMLSKSERYWFDAAAIAEAAKFPEGSWGRTSKYDADTSGKFRTMYGDGRRWEGAETRNRRSVWTVSTEPYSEAHFATFPPALIEPCILAGCPSGGTVLDCFGGAGTTGLVSDRLSRHAILIELNPLYAGMSERRIYRDGPLFADVAIDPMELTDAAE
jgi:DNA modification methylase